MLSSFCAKSVIHLREEGSPVIDPGNYERDVEESILAVRSRCHSAQFQFRRARAFGVPSPRAYHNDLR